MLARGLPAAAALALCLALCACAALPWPSGRERTLGAVESGDRLDLRGVVHVHTRVSHDSSGSIGEVIDGARSAGASWIAFTEHVRRNRLAPPQGRVEGVLLLPGWEIPAEGGSILALGVASRDGLPREPAALVEAIHARGGAAFIGHLERSRLATPERFAGLGMDGLEIANLHANAAHVPIRLALGQLFLPAAFGLRALVQTPEENLALWARLPSARAVVAGVDAHAKFRALGPLGGTFDRYRDLFRLVTTHVLATELTPAAIVAALREGRSYVAFEALAAVDRFEFARAEDGVLVRAPREARLALVCAGAEVASATAARATLALPAGAEACHVEAWLGSRLWIVTSRV